MIGENMAMPPDFAYRDVFLKGKPQHDKMDPFRIRHPCMDLGRRAKIFAPVDALKGYGEAVAAKEELYEGHRELSPEYSAEISRRLEILRNLTRNSKLARENHVMVSVTYFETCTDENHESYGQGGQYKTITGICRNIDVDVSRMIQVDDFQIPLTNILEIECPGDFFQEDWLPA